MGLGIFFNQLQKNWMIMLRTKIHNMKSLCCSTLAGCNRPDGYPDDWASPDKGWFNRLNDCPDMRGQYDGANENLIASLIGMDSIRMRERFVDQRVEVRQPDARQLPIQKISPALKLTASDMRVPDL
jgi:hypothetical protein